MPLFDTLFVSTHTGQERQLLVIRVPEVHSHFGYLKCIVGAVSSTVVQRVGRILLHMQLITMHDFQQTMCILNGK